MQHCKEGVIDITVTFAGMSQTNSNQYLIAFDFTFNRGASKQQQYNEEPLVKLMKSLQNYGGCPGTTQRLKTEEILLQNYEEFFGLI